MLRTHSGYPEKEQEEAKQQNQRQQGIERAFGLPAVSGKQSEDEEYGKGGQHLTAVDIKACHLVVEQPPYQGIAENIADKYRHGGGVGPDNGQIRDNECPARQESMVIPHDLLHIGEKAAVILILLCELAEVGPDNQHGNTGNSDGDNTAYRPGKGQKQTARHHEEGPPAHGTAKGQRPDI